MSYFQYQQSRFTHHVHALAALAHDWLAADPRRVAATASLALRLFVDEVVAPAHAARTLAPETQLANGQWWVLGAAADLATLREALHAARAQVLEEHLAFLHGARLGHGPSARRASPEAATPRDVLRLAYQCRYAQVKRRRHQVFGGEPASAAATASWPAFAGRRWSINRGHGSPWR